jgi:hypothetical protein
MSWTRRDFNPRPKHSDLGSMRALGTRDVMIYGGQPGGVPSSGAAKRGRLAGRCDIRRTRAAHGLYCVRQKGRRHAACVDNWKPASR